MRNRILEASLRVLQQEGALGFTTTRVADEAGISVGSLYQYFPNKHALVFALHDDDIERGWEHIQAVLDRTGVSPRQKLAEVTRWFFATETEEVAQLGAAIGDIELFLRDRAATRDILPHAIARFAARRSPRSSSRRETTNAGRTRPPRWLVTTWTFNNRDEWHPSPWRVYRAVAVVRACAPVFDRRS